VLFEIVDESVELVHGALEVLIVQRPEKTRRILMQARMSRENLEIAAFHLYSTPVRKQASLYQSKVNLCPLKTLRKG
jgi:hypothetical protein